MYKRKFKILLSIGIGLLSIAGIMFAASQKLVADKKEEPQKPEKIVPMCYSQPALSSYYTEPEYQTLLEEDKKLEKLYAEGKINKETYDIRKNKIKNQMQKIEKEHTK